MANKTTLELAVLALVIAGGINWGLVGLFNLNLVDKIFGSVAILPTIVYILVGLAALSMLYTSVKK